MSTDSPQRVIIVMPAYNAARTLQQVLEAIPSDSYDEILVVDDCSSDDTVEVASALPVTVIRHERNLGYGGNQKTCYTESLARAADYVVMLHPDGQYDARTVTAAVAVLKTGTCDVVLGNRIRTRHEALAGGMPKLKYFANRALTLIENVLTGQNLGEWHSGFRAFNRKVLETVPFERNEDGFVFDSQFLLQCVHFGFRLGDVPIGVRYFPEASSISLSDSATYALRTLKSLGGWLLHRTGLRSSPLFAPVDAPGHTPNREELAARYTIVSEHRA